MAKNIILLSDGTGNSNIKNRGTNVFKLYEALNCNQLNGYPEQIAFYDDGVGTEELKPLKFLGSAFGYGLSRNVRELYKNLARSYEPGDRIYLFGFSRGAFTVRTLAGLIARMGILDIGAYPTDYALESAVIELYEQYRKKNTALLERLFSKYRIKKVINKKLHLKTDENGSLLNNIEFIGVWDTVDAVGLPFKEATDFWDKYIFRFKFSNKKLHPVVKKACHALSIDDDRLSFHPLLWQQDSRVEQIWFPGVHANVGGGYPQQGLSLIALEWMMEKAEQAGLHYIEGAKEFVRNQKYVLDKLYNPRSGFGVYYRYKPRNIAEICSANGITKPQLHISIFQRIAEGVLGYAPCVLPSDFDVVDNNGIHSNSVQIQTQVNSAPGLQLTSPLLEQTSWLYRLRNLNYYIFLAYSVVTLHWLLKDELKQSWFAALKALVSPDSLLDKAAILLWENPLLSLAGVTIFAYSLFLRKKMNDYFAMFWSPLRAKLKSLI